MALPNLSDAYRTLAAGGLDYDIQTELNISSQAHVTVKYSRDGSDSFIQLMVEPGSDVHYRWDGSSGNTIDADEDFILRAATLYKITLPLKLAKRNLANGKDTFIHFKQLVSVSSKALKLVKI